MRYFPSSHLKLVGLAIALVAAVVPASPAQADSVVMIAGDIACEPEEPTTPTTCHEQQTSDLLVAENPDRVLTAGDNQYETGGLAAFRDSYDPTWGRVKNKTRPTPGNHEYRRPEAKGYFKYFGWRAGRKARGYYGFDIEDWHLIALNSNIGVGRGSRQVDWLRRNLESNPSKCTLAYFHHPLYSSGEHGNNSKMKQIYRVLNAASIELVVAGHDHNYERFAPMNANGERRSDGIRAFVVGTGGRDLGPFDNIKRHSRVRDADTFGVLKLTLEADAYGWEFVPEEGKTFTDSGHDACH